IQSIDVVDFSGTEGASSFHRLEDVELDVQAYELHAGSDGGAIGVSEEGGEGDDEESIPQLNILALPSETLKGIWESLIFATPIHSKLLRFTTRMMSISRKQFLNSAALNWNRLIMLHGPPGSGKTSLCRALAQKLTIRLGRFFTTGKLVEINSQSLLSKWFGESGKLVSKTFDRIQSLSDDETTIVCVLIDEVESLTASREKSATGNECGDAMRATNQLLTGLDRLRHRPNVIVLCTSNLVMAIDSAFLDRVDVKQFVPNPEPRAVYEILRSCLNELIRCEIITTTGHQEQVSPTSDSATDDSYPDSSFVLVDQASIPSFAEMNVHLWDQPNSPAMRLWNIAQKCESMSGRSLRRLPALALAMHTFSDPCSIYEALEALSVEV
ncbi:AAA-domain-containing protein, partial [Saccharata proteae CBS 121410]